MHNDGNYIVSLGNVVRWLGQQAEALASRSIRASAAAEVLYNADGSVKGIATGDMGVGRTANPAPTTSRASSSTPARRSFRKAAGSLTKGLFERFNLREGVDPQTYGIGIRSCGRCAPRHQQGLTDAHRGLAGCPPTTYGGSFLYHLENNQVAVGFVVGLDYSNPHICRPTRSSSASRPTRRSARSSRAAGASPTARGRSTRAASSRCPSCPFPAAC